MTGVAVEVSVFGSNEEMLAKLQAGGTGWDVFVPTNYTITTYVDLDLIEPLDLSLLPSFNAGAYERRFTEAGEVNGTVYAVPKDWGTTGYVVNTAEVEEPMTTWKQFWDLSMDKYSGRTMVHDYQLTTIGNALKYFGYSFNSVDPAELADAEKLLLDAKPHLFAINSDYQPSMRNGDAWMSVAWTGDAKQLNRDIPEIVYVLGREGGEIWCRRARRTAPPATPSSTSSWTRRSMPARCRRTAIRPPTAGPTRCCRKSCSRTRSSIRRRTSWLRSSSAQRRP
jgi:spermidine/putrescine transport system substrate-binding protein